MSGAVLRDVVEFSPVTSEELRHSEVAEGFDVSTGPSAAVLPNEVVAPAVPHPERTERRPRRSRR